MLNSIRWGVPACLLVVVFSAVKVHADFILIITILTSAILIHVLASVLKNCNTEIAQLKARLLNSENEKQKLRDEFRLMENLHRDSH